GPPFYTSRRRLLRHPRRGGGRLVRPARDRLARPRPEPGCGPAAWACDRRRDGDDLAGGVSPGPDHPQAGRRARAYPGGRGRQGRAGLARPVLWHWGGGLLPRGGAAGVRDPDLLRRLRAGAHRPRQAVPDLDPLGRPRGRGLRRPVRGDRRPARARHGPRRPQRGHAPDLEALQGEGAGGPV
ncbi:MAG: hypothetical protein AVDCRST_MAG22-3314, partial [uncultured Rubrobacteraceae bacterium]